MKARSAFFKLFLLGLLLISLINCQKEAIQTDSTVAIIFYPTLTYGSVTDIEGNVYKTITIGTQTWMAENLKTTKYRNGDPIANVTENTGWSALSTGAYCWFKNDAATYKGTFGALYNWYAVADSRNIAPTGWHVSTSAEWTTLTTYLGTDPGSQLKETGVTHWITPNTGATNKSGFTALPGGLRYHTDGAFSSMGTNGLWWTKTTSDATNAWYSSLYYTYSTANLSSLHRQFGFSVRCVKD